MKDLAIVPRGPGGIAPSGRIGTGQSRTCVHIGLCGVHIHLKNAFRKSAVVPAA